MRRFTVVVEQDEDSGWLVASVPSLRGCHTQARSWEELIANAREVLALCLETDEGDGKEPIEGDAPLVGAFQIEAWGERRGTHRGPGSRQRPDAIPTLRRAKD